MRRSRLASASAAKIGNVRQQAPQPSHSKDGIGLRPEEDLEHRVGPSSGRRLRGVDRPISSASRAKLTRLAVDGSTIGAPAGRATERNPAARTGGVFIKLAAAAELALGPAAAGTSNALRHSQASPG